jgi:tetratricopeptide (TPR) repeat protein
MKKIISAATALALMVMVQAIGQAAEVSCPAKDSVCKEFAKLTNAGQFEKLIAQVDAAKTYSRDSQDMIGQAYLLLAGKEGNTPEQEEQLCRKALEYGATSAYMGLYFLYSGTNTEAALGFLKQYIAAGAPDAVPYVLLGEAEMDKENYAAANAYFREAKKMSRGVPRDLDWALFKTSYLTGDYHTASTMLNSAFSQGKTVGDLKALVVDQRFSDMGKRMEFKKFFPIINGTTTARM